MQESERFAARVEGVSGSAIRELFKLTSRPGVISFGGGNPSPAALPDEIVADICRELVATNGKVLLQYGMTEGLPALRESLTGYLQSEFGVTTDAGCILPVTGSTQAFNLLLDAYTDPGDVILTENPTFLGATQAMHLHQLRVIPVDSDEQGLRVDALEEAIRRHRPRMLYTIPTFQNPTGRTLTLERRKAVAEIIARHPGVVLIEDDPYRDLRYAGEALPAIKAFDTTDRIVYCNSFSKIISPGLRVAAAVCTEPTLMRKLVIGKQSTDVHSPNLNQAIVDAYLREGILMDHIRKISESYGKQMAKMQEMLSTFPASVKYTRPDGGIFLWVELPEGFNATKLLTTATEMGVAYIPGTHFYAVPDTHHNTMRLNFSNATLENIEKGMTILKELFISQGLK